MNYKTASICVIGTELTQGIIADKHCKLISSELTKLGIHTNDMNIINDDGSIKTKLVDMVDESDIIIITGGLGPTSDDMTRESVAHVAGVELYQDEASLLALREKLGDRVDGANIIQTMFPKTFTPVVNPLGTAPGFKGFINKNNRSVAIAAMPGPPRELNEMFFSHILPWIATLVGKEELEREEYSSFLIGESVIEEISQRCRVGAVQWGTRFQEYKISYFLSDGTKEDRLKMFNNLQKECGPDLMVKGNTTALDTLTNDLMINKETISCSESCTGGLCAKLLTDLSGSSSYFYGGVVSYANEAKMSLLGVKKETLEKYGAVSSQTVIEMAEGINKISSTTYSLSTSGIAGPTGGTDDKPLGTIWFGFASKNLPSQSVCVKIFSYGRESVRRRAATTAFILLEKYKNGVNLQEVVKEWKYI
ncbi:MAG: nicotinamide-nucleotide amidohydrolase family protein [Spirochaetaceae bacterium]|nr:nicotinamide-nucleotide amidohydrolase family protein [Spirochaetaceae bacterium]